MNRRFILALLAGISLTTTAFAENAPPKARVYIISPLNGETVSSPVTVRFGLSDLPKLDEPIPVDDNHKHFGGGQTETRIALPPGQHTLQLLMGNWTHVPHNPPVMSEKITITVE